MAYEERVKNSEQSYRVAATFRLLCLVPENTELSLTVCGIERYAPAQSYGPCRRDDYHLHFVLAGKGTLRIEENYYYPHRGQVFVVPPDVEIHYYCDDAEPWHYTWVSFTGTKAAYYLEKAGITMDAPVRDCYIKPEEFLAYTEKILNCHELTIANELLRNSLLYEILALLVSSQDKKLTDSHQPAEHSYSPDVYVDYAVEYIHYNYDHIRVSDIADYIGITRSYLTHIFKQKLNVSPQEYLLTYRLDQSLRLLRSTGLSIQEISEKIGYENPLTFSKMFKNAYGLSPKNYRLQMVDPTPDSPKKASPAS